MLIDKNWIVLIHVQISLCIYKLSRDSSVFVRDHKLLFISAENASINFQKNKRQYQL